MDAQGPHDRDIDQGQVELLVERLAAVFLVKVVKAADEVEDQIAKQYQRVPGQHRVGHVVNPDDRQHVPQTIGATHVRDNEQHAHQHGRDRQHFPQDRHFVQGLVVIDVRREHNGNCGSGDTDQENEVGQIQAVMHLIGQAGVVQSFGRMQIGAVQQSQNEQAKKGNPGIEGRTALDYVADVIDDKWLQLVHDVAPQSMK
jgi:hypothetical protein